MGVGARGLQYLTDKFNRQVHSYIYRVATPDKQWFFIILFS